MIKFALIGYGRAGKFHVQWINHCQNRAYLCVVIDANPDILKQVKRDMPSVGVSSDLTDDILTSVDAIIVASTTHTHFKYIKRGINANKHVFTEKPISLNADEVREIIGLANENRVVFKVNYQRRHDSQFCQLKSALQARKHEMKYINITSRDNPEPPLPYLKTSGGIFHDMLTHDFDMVNFLGVTGLPKSVFSSGYAWNPEIGKMDDIDMAVVVLTYPNGLIVSINTCRAANYGYDQRIEILDNEGMISLRNENSNSLVLSNENGHTEAPFKYSFPQRYAEAYVASGLDFLQRIEDSKYDDDFQRYLDVDIIADLAEQSWRENKLVLV